MIPRRWHGLFILFVLATSFVLFLRSGNSELPVDLIAVTNAPPVSDFELNSLDGDLVRLSQLKGRVVLINFWATWCPPCREEMPSLQNAAIYFDDENFNVLAINVGETNEQVRVFADEFGLTSDLTLLLDHDSRVFEQLDSRVLPTSLIVDRSGHLRYRAIGPRQFDSESILQLIENLLNAS